MVTVVTARVVVLLRVAVYQVTVVWVGLGQIPLFSSRTRGLASAAVTSKSEEIVLNNIVDCR